MACRSHPASARRSRKKGVFQDRPLYGPLMNLPEMVHEPLNELGVVFAFGLWRGKLGFSVLRFQAAFPTARRSGRWHAGNCSG